MTDIIERLRDDNEYYGPFGKQYLSYSSIDALINNPQEFGNNVEKTIPMVLGSYLHTLVLEPHKVDSFKIVDASTRNTKVYKEISEGELCMLQKEADAIQVLRDRLMANETVSRLIQDPSAKYEEPMVSELHGEMWKGKADIVTDEYIIDLKTTNDIKTFKSSCYRRYYNAQAYIYSQMFGKEFVFIVIDKKTGQIGAYDCSNQFYMSGRDRVIEAVTQYRLLFKDQEFDPTNYLIKDTL